MPFIYVVLKNGTKVAVPDADEADWMQERLYPGSDSGASILRLVCKRGNVVLGRFNADDISGYVWQDGRAPGA